MALLDVTNLSIHFGGVKAVQSVSFSIDPGIIYSVIGPNGAGKTTLFNLITGVYTPTSGEIRLDGESIQGKSPNQLAERGMARTFQNLQVCMNMTAIETSWWAPISDSTEMSSKQPCDSAASERGIQRCAKRPLN